VIIEDTAGGVLARESAPGLSTLQGPVWRGVREVEHARACRDGDWIIAAARPRDDLLGAVCVFDPNCELTDEVLFLIEAAATVVAFVLRQISAISEVELRIWGDLTCELLEDRDTSRAERHAAALGYDVDQPHRAVAVDVKGCSAGALTAAIRRTATIVGLSSQLLTIRDSYALLLVSAHVDWEQFDRVLTRELGTRQRVGIGRLHELDSLKESVTEAELALSVSKGGVVKFEDLGVLAFLAADADPGRLRDLVSQWIGPLVVYDAAHRSALVATLSEYLRNQGALEITARRLSIHPNTLKYRVRHISQLIGRDLHDADVRFNLELACRALDAMTVHSLLA
jgi:sugar diacid utilization regulator